MPRFDSAHFYQSRPSARWRLPEQVGRPLCQGCTHRAAHVQQGGFRRAHPVGRPRREPSALVAAERADDVLDLALLVHEHQLEPRDAELGVEHHDPAVDAVREDVLHQLTQAREVEGQAGARGGEVGQPSPGLAGGDELKARLVVPDQERRGTVARRGQVRIRAVGLGAHPPVDVEHGRGAIRVSEHRRGCRKWRHGDLAA